jgi:hypothetical protein
VFTDETLDNALLPQGAVATATDRLRELVGQGLAEFLTTTTRSTRPCRPRLQRQGTGSGR